MKRDCPDCRAMPGNGRCDAHRKHAYMGRNPKKRCPKCKGLCAVSASRCAKCLREERQQNSVESSREGRQVRSMPSSERRLRYTGKPPTNERWTYRGIELTPPRDIADSHGPKPHKEWMSRIEREQKGKRKPKPIIIQEKTDAPARAFPKREAVAVSRANQSHVRFL